MTKWPVQKQTPRTPQQHVKRQDATGIQKKNNFLYTISSMTSPNV